MAAAARKLALLFQLLWLVAACSGLQTGNEVQAGRMALLTGNPEAALAHFKAAAEADPNYVNPSDPLQQGVWTYLGRAYYTAGKFPEARDALGRALAKNGNDFMARFYLGLTLLRQPNPAPAENSLSLDSIVYALKERVTPKRLASLVKDRGVNFELTKSAEEELRKWGADGELLEQVQVKAELIKARERESERAALKEFTEGLRGMDKWLQYTLTTPQGQFWDPTKKLKSQIDSSLAASAKKNPNRQELISGGEWLGKALDEEVDMVRRSEREELNRLQRR
jgi:tetratricopeptide (TPR) repeat protein